GGRRSVPGDVPAGISSVSRASGGRERAGVALRDRYQPLPQSCAWRGAPPSSLGGREHRRLQRRPRVAGGSGHAQRDDRADRQDRGRAAIQATRGVHDAQDARAALRGDRREPQLLRGKRAGARLPGAQEDSPRARRGCESADGGLAMTRAYPSCREVEPELMAVGMGEGSPASAQVVEAHIADCSACRDELGRYRALDRVVADMGSAPAPADPALARAQLESRLGDLRRRVISFGVFSSPLGPILIARTEEGVSMVRYLESETPAASHLARLVGVDAVEDERYTRAL